MSVIDHRRRRPLVGRRRLAAALAGLMLLAGSCGNDDSPPVASPDTTATTAGSTPRSSTTDSDDGQETTSTTTGPTATTAPPRPTTPGDQASPDEQEVIERYLAYWDARLAANTGTPDPAHPALAEHATGAQLDAVIAETQQNLDDGLVLRPRPDSADVRRVTVVSIEGDEAVVQECLVDDGLVVQRDTGDVVNDTVATHNVRGELTRVDGDWKVSAALLVQRWEGVAGCALDS